MADDDAAGGSSGTRGGPQLVMAAPRPYIPDVEKPKLNGVSLMEVEPFLKRLERYVMYLKKKGVAEADAIDYVRAECFGQETVRRWADDTAFTGTWSDFADKFKAEWFYTHDRIKVGHALLYRVWQNKSSVSEYSTQFKDHLAQCQLVNFSCSPDVLLTAYMRGLREECQKELARSGKPKATWQECELTLLELEASGVFVQPRGSEDKKPYNKKLYNSSNDNNNNISSVSNDGEKKNSSSSNVGANSGGHTSGGGSWSRGVSGPGGGGRGKPHGGDRVPRDLGAVVCLRCNKLGHIARNCRASNDVVEAYQASKGG